MTIVFIAGIFIGGTLGVMLMCLFQAVKEIDDVDREECEKQKK